MLRNLWDDLEKIRNARAAYLTELGVKRKAYKDALESHETALNSSTVSEIRNFSEQLHKLLEQLGQVAQGVSTLESLGFTGLTVDDKIERAQEQRKLIGNVLEHSRRPAQHPSFSPHRMRQRRSKLLIHWRTRSRTGASTTLSSVERYGSRRMSAYVSRLSDSNNKPSTLKNGWR